MGDMRFTVVLLAVACATEVRDATFDERRPRITVTVKPSTATTSIGQTVQLTATVTGTRITAVTWSADEGGSVTASGLYTAPSTPGTYHVVARSVADPTKSATATITVTGFALLSEMYGDAGDVAQQRLEQSLLTGATF